MRAMSKRETTDFGAGLEQVFNEKKSQPTFRFVTLKPGRMLI